MTDIEAYLHTLQCCPSSSHCSSFLFATLLRWSCIGSQARFGQCQIQHEMRISHLGRILLPTLLGAAQVLGISQRDAGLHDWHLELIGLPAVEAGTRPRFHYPAGASNTASSSLVYTATQKNVLAALDPKTGAIGEFEKVKTLVAPPSLISSFSFAN